MSQTNQDHYGQQVLTKRAGSTGFRIVAATGCALMLAVSSGGFAPVACAADANQGARATSMQKDMNAAISADRKNQSRMTELTARLDRVADESRNARLEIPMLELEEKRLMRQIAFLESRSAQMTESIRRGREIDLLLGEEMVTVIESLEAMNASGMPFARAERKARIDQLRASVGDASVTTGEKFRRLAEALSVEAEYGLSTEVSTETVLLDGKSTTASVIRVGKAGLFALTLDRKTAGVWDGKTGPVTSFTVKSELLPVIDELSQAMQRKFQTGLVSVPVAKNGEGR